MNSPTPEAIARTVEYRAEVFIPTIRVEEFTLFPKPAPTVHRSGLARPSYPVSPEPAHPQAKHGRECICWECVQGRMLEEW